MLVQYVRTKANYIYHYQTATQVMSLLLHSGRLLLLLKMGLANWGLAPQRKKMWVLAQTKSQT